MRVTSSMVKEQIMDSLSAGQERLLNIQKQISTTRDVSAPSDDPVRFNQAARYKSFLSRNEQYLVNIEDGIAWVQNSVDTLAQLHELAVLVREDGLQARSDTFNAADRLQTAEAVKGLLDEMLLLGNYQFRGKYVFGGTITKNTEPFDFDGATVTYQGNTNAIRRKIGADDYLEINLAGSRFVDIYDATIALRDALQANDGFAMDAALAQLETGTETLLEASTVIGSKLRQLDLTRTNLEMANANLRSYISQSEDVDLAEAILKYNTQELGYRAALESSARIMNISILNHLR